MSALSVACSMQDVTFDDKDNNESLLEIIFKHCPDINRKDQMGKTPLHHAAKADNLTAAKFLIECKYQKIDVNSKTLVSRFYQY